MNKVFVFIFSLFMFVIPVTAFAQPVHYAPHLPVPYSHYKRVLYCYDVILPVPHSKCEYRYVRVNYMPMPPTKRHHPTPQMNRSKPPHKHHQRHHK